MSCGGRKRLAMFDGEHSSSHLSLPPCWRISRSPSPIRCRPGTKARRRKPSSTSWRASPRKGGGLRAAGRAHRRLRQRRHAMGEQPIYFQFVFALDRVKVLAPQHPEWKDAEPFKSVLEGDTKALAAAGEKGLARSHARLACRHDDGGLPATVSEWLRDRAPPEASTGHTTKLVYRRSSSFSPTCAPTGSRPSSSLAAASSSCAFSPERAYGIPPEQVVGSSAAS